MGARVSESDGLMAPPPAFCALPTDLCLPPSHRLFDPAPGRWLGCLLLTAHYLLRREVENLETLGGLGEMEIED
jgi:hypothetical protein